MTFLPWQDGESPVDKLIAANSPFARIARPKRNRLYDEMERFRGEAFPEPDAEATAERGTLEPQTAPVGTEVVPPKQLPVPPREPTRLEALETEQAQRQNEATHRSLKSKIFGSLAQAAPMILGGVFGGVEGAAGAGEGTAEWQDQQRADEQRRENQLLLQMEAERDRQQREADRKLQEEMQQFNIEQRRAQEAQKQREAARSEAILRYEMTDKQPGPPVPGPFPYVTSPAPEFKGTGGVVPMGQGRHAPITIPSAVEGRPGFEVTPRTQQEVLESQLREKGLLSDIELAQRGQELKQKLDIEGKTLSPGETWIRGGSRFTAPDRSKLLTPDEEKQRIRIARAGSATLNPPQEVTESMDALARALASGDPQQLVKLRDVTALRGDQRLVVYGRAKKLNPNFSPAEVDRKIKMLDWVTNGKGADQLQSYNTFLEHAGALVDAMEAVNLYGSPLFNKPLNWIRANLTGNPEYTALLTALDPVKKEFETFLLNNHALYAEDRASADKIMSEDSSPAMMLSAVKQMGHTATARANEMNFRFRRTVGTNIPDMYSPEAVRGAQRIGLNVGNEAGAGGGRPGEGQIKMLNGQKVRVIRTYPDGTADVEPVGPNER